MLCTRAHLPTVATNYASRYCSTLAIDLRGQLYLRPISNWLRLFFLEIPGREMGTLVSMSGTYLKANFTKKHAKKRKQVI